MLRTFRGLIRNEKGATAIEYGLIAELMSIATIGALTSMGGSLNTLIGSISGNIDSAVQGGATGTGSGTP